jgi:hypothetical protein
MLFLASQLAKVPASRFQIFIFCFFLPRKLGVFLIDGPSSFRAEDRV